MNCLLPVTDYNRGITMRKRQKKPGTKVKNGLQKMLDLRGVELEILSSLSRTFWTAMDRQILSYGLFRLLVKRFDFDALLFLLQHQEGYKLFLTSGYTLKVVEQHALCEKLRKVCGICSDIAIIPGEVLPEGHDTEKRPNLSNASVHAVSVAIMDKVHGHIGMAFADNRALGKGELDFLQVVANEVALVEENQRIQATLTDERNLLGSILHSMTCAILVVDEHMKILLSNPMADAVFGWESKRVTGQFLEKVVDVGAVLSLFKAVTLHANEYLSSEIEIPNKGRGKSMIARANLAKVRGGLGPSSGVVMVLNDITLEKEMDRARTEFVSVASHELRTPMAAIREAVSLIIDGVVGPINEKQHRFLDMTKRNIDRLADIINDLLDLSKIESGNLVINRELVSPQNIVDEVFVMFEAASQEKGISLLKDVDEELPKISLDQDKMIQVLGNLVSNAIKFTPKDGMVTIGLRKGRQKEKSVEFYVQDTGIGIERKNYGKLFRKFQQIDSALSRSVGGTGLGLAITKEIVELHGGRVRVESEPGRGSTFHVVIPVSPGAAARKRHVLVATSDQELKTLVHDALEEKSIEVSDVSRGREVRQTVTEELPDLIFLDAQLPDMDAFDICRQLMEDPYTAFVPIVLLTQPGQESSVWKVLSMGVRGYLVGPVDTRTVVTTVEEILT